MAGWLAHVQRFENTKKTNHFQTISGNTFQTYFSKQSAGLRAVLSLPGNEDFSFILPPALSKKKKKENRKPVSWSSLTSLCGSHTETRGSHQRDKQLKIERGPCKIPPGIIWSCVMHGLFWYFFFFPAHLSPHKGRVSPSSLSVSHTSHSPFHVQNHSISPPPFPIIYILTGRDEQGGTDGRTHSCGGHHCEVTVPAANTAGEKKKTERNFVDLCMFSRNQSWNENYWSIQVENDHLFFFFSFRSM